MTAQPNADQTEHWNADEARHWVSHHADYDRMLAPFTARLLAEASLGSGDAVLDVGCGCGATTIAAAQAAAPNGFANGVDLSHAMTSHARTLVDAASVRNVTFEVADAQTHPFPAGTYDRVISRFGVMFFDDPVAAFANMASAMRPGGVLAFVCWQDLAANEWMLVPGAAIAEHITLPDFGEAGAPGPFSLAEPERIAAILTSAGFADIEIEDCRERQVLGGGPSVAGTIEFLRNSGMGRAVLDGADPAAIPAVLDAVAAALEPYATPDGVVMTGAAWLVTAHPKTAGRAA